MLPSEQDNAPASGDQPAMSSAAAFGRGVAHTLPGATHLGALADTAESYLPKFFNVDQVPDQTGKGFKERYSENLARERGLDEAAMAQHPYISIATPLVGSAAVLPAGVAGAGTSLAARTAASAGVGAGYGAAYGADNANSWSDVIPQALTGAGIGAVGGAIAHPLASGIGKGFQAASDLLNISPRQLVPRSVRAMFGNPDAGVEDIGARKIAGTMGHGEPALTPPEFQAAQAAGQNPVVADLGTEATRRLAKAAANTSPEAGGILKTFTGDRFQGQQDEVQQFLTNKFGKLDLAQTKADELADAAIRNAPLYKQAYQAGGGGVWNRDLEALAASPYVQRNVKTAVDMANDYVAKNGGSRITNPFKVQPNGSVALATDRAGNPMVPSLMFWDQIQRSMRGQIGKLYASGQKALALPMQDTQDKLLAALDNAVPAFGAARQSAYQGFQAQNALDAGRKFYGMVGNMDVNTQKALQAKMSAPEQKLFAHGFAGELLNRVMTPGQSRNVVNMFTSPLLRQKVETALGPTLANETEAHVQHMAGMDMLRTALGNSTSAQQLHDVASHGIVGQVSGAMGSTLGGAMAGAVAAHETGHDVVHGAAAGAFAGMLKGRYSAVNQAVKKSIAEQLTSGDPTKVNAAAARIGKDPKLMQWLRTTVGYLAGSTVAPALNPTSPVGGQ